MDGLIYVCIYVCICMHICGYGVLCHCGSKCSPLLPQRGRFLRLRHSVSKTLSMYHGSPAAVIVAVSRAEHKVPKFSDLEADRLNTTVLCRPGQLHHHADVDLMYSGMCSVVHLYLEYRAMVRATVRILRLGVVVLCWIASS